MSADLKNQLRGTREEVKNAAADIANKFKKIIVRGTDSVAAEANIYALKFNIQVLRALCLALQENYFQNADIYCDIVGLMLPHVKPCTEKPVLWSTHLTSLRYIHHGIGRESPNECQRIYTIITAQPCNLQAEGDYKVYLAIHSHHFNICYQQLQKQKTSAKTQLYNALEELGKLFDKMREEKLAKKFNYDGFMDELNQMFFYKRSSSFLNFLSTLAEQQTIKMYGPLFNLLSVNNITAESSEQMPQIRDYLGVFLALLQIDIFTVKLQQQLAVRLLRNCRILFKQIPAQYYGINLLYYYVKLMYVREDMPEFKRAYIDLCMKIVTFFESNGAAHAKEQWFMDIIVVFQRVQMQLHKESGETSPPFDAFWRHMDGKDSAEGHALHIEMLRNCIKAAVHITGSQLGSSCNNEVCNSMRKHCILSFGTSALVAYVKFQQCTDQKHEEKFVTSLRQHLLYIVRYIIEVMASLKCMEPSKIDSKNLVRYVGIIAMRVTSAAEMCFLLRLVEPLQNNRHLFDTKEITLLLRRIKKVSMHCDDKEMAAKLQCAFIGATKCPSWQRMLVSTYYRTSANDIPNCVYELHESSPLCNPLSPAEKRQLYNIDMSIVTTYYRTNITLLQSLQRCRQTEYQFVILARHMRSDKDVARKLEEVRLNLQRSAYKHPLTRLQYLISAHATVSALLEGLETQKLKNPMPIKDMLENQLEELFIKHDCFNIHIGNEKRLVDLATEAVSGFKAFFDKADEEPLSSDEALIDWEALIDDATVAAQNLLTMGYLPEADEAWHLILRVTDLLGDRFGYLRAVTHFLVRATHNDSIAQINVDLSREVVRAQQMLDELSPQMHSVKFLQRQQTVVMLCLCHLAHYYACLGQLCHAQLLLHYVEQMRNKFPERQGKCDIVMIMGQLMRFRILYQQQHCRPMPRMPTAVRIIDTIVESLRNFICISSIDQGAFVLLMCDLVREVCECTTNRLSERVNVISSLLNCTLQAGLALRTIEVLLLWLWSNLQMECLDKAQSKMRLIEHLLCIQTLRQNEWNQIKTALQKETLPNHVNEMVSKMMLMQLYQDPGAVEPIRKQNQIDIGSLRLHDSLSPMHLTLNRYTDGRDLPFFARDSVQLQCVYFSLGCLQARLCFLNKEHEQLDDFYEQASNWLHQHVSQSKFLGHMLLVQELFRVNFLRATKKHQAAITCVKEALLNVAKMQRRTDINYQYNLLVQLKGTQVELKSKPNAKCKFIGLRRALRFEISPREEATIYSDTPIDIENSATRNKKPLKQSVKLKADIFSNQTSYLSSGSECSQSSSENEILDLNACQVIDFSDDDDVANEKPTGRQLQRTKSVTNRVENTTKRRLQPTSTVVEIINLDDSIQKASAKRPAGKLQRCVSADVNSTRVTRNRKNSPEETPKSTTKSARGRPRRQNTAMTEPSATASTTRLRQRN